MNNFSMKKIYILFLINSLIFIQFPLIAQDTSDSTFLKVYTGDDFIQLFQKMVDLEIVFEAPSGNFVQNQAGDGYINPHNEAQIIALYIPIPYQLMLPQIKVDDEGYEVMEKNILWIKGKECFYRKEIYPSYTNQEDFVGVMVFMPYLQGTISISAACPKSLEKEYCELFMHSINTLRIID